MAQPQAVPVASLKIHFCPFAAPMQLALVLAFNCTRSWGALNSDFLWEESKSPRDDVSKLGSPLRVVSKVEELKWGFQGVWVGPASPQGKVVQAPFPTGSLFHEPAEQMRSWFLAKLFCKVGDLSLCRGGNPHPTHVQTWMTGLLGAGPIALPTWWRKTKS